jgi:hypothetical protein
MLAYVFWHRPAGEVEIATYEQALLRFHRSLRARPPVGLRGSAVYRAVDLPWLEGEGPGYEDWYLVDDWAALGVLNAGAVAPGHRHSHNEIARRSGPGAGALYGLCEGEPVLEAVRVAIWVSAARGSNRDVVAGLLADGIDGDYGGLWQRQLVLGPTPEYCLLAREAPVGVAPTRLPAGWHATEASRALVAL